MPKRDLKLFVNDIKESIEAIFDYIKILEFDEFIEDRKTYSAVIRDGSAQGTIVATSNTIVVVDDALVTMSASGGSQSNISGYRVHTLLSSTNITFNKGGSIEYLIIGGGGSYMTHGGGGAGGLLQGTTTVTSTTYPVTVGIGGVGNGTNGGNTTALGFTAFGGGAGTNDGIGGGPGPAAPGPRGSGLPADRHRSRG
jgi:hypothetical protein